VAQTLTEKLQRLKGPLSPATRHRLRKEAASEIHNLLELAREADVLRLALATSLEITVAGKTTKYPCGDSAVVSLTAAKEAA
jgi:hypothetical protein